MYDIFSGLKTLLKLDYIIIDNNVFRLHYKLTMILLLILSLVNTSRQYIGEPINCIVDGIPHPVVNLYCWISSTFTVVNKFGIEGINIGHPGVAPYSENHDQVQHHKYYQWVCFVLFFQAILFYIPRYIWKIWEGGRARSLTSDLKFAYTDQETMDAKCQTFCEYFLRNLKNHNVYFYRFAFCELLNLVNVVGQIFLMNRFLDGEFTTYGLEVLNFMETDAQKRIDPMSRVFPKMAKCTFHKYGPSGTIEKMDGLCVLPINVVNEKIYILLWFWFIILTVITSLAIIYRMVTIISPQMRFFLLKSKLRLSRPEDVAYICNRFQIGDWFIFYQMSKNVEMFVFKKIVKDIAISFLQSEKHSI